MYLQVEEPRYQTDPSLVNKFVSVTSSVVAPIVVTYIRLYFKDTFYMPICLYEDFEYVNYFEICLSIRLTRVVACVHFQEA